MSTTWIRVVYGVVLALVLLFTAAFGVAMALPGPEPPGDPGITFRQLTAGGDEDSSQNRLSAAIDEYYGRAKDFRDDYVTYQRNAFLAGAGIAALIAIIGLALPAAVNYMRWGLLLGAAFVLVWAGWLATKSVPGAPVVANSILAFVAVGEPEPLDFAGRFLRFAVGFVSLILLVFLGLWRLTEWPSASRRVVPTAPVPATTPAPAVAGAWAPPPPSSTPAPAAPSEPPLNRAAVEDVRSTTVAGTVPVVTESAPRAEAAPPEALPWSRPDEGDGAPARRPDAPV